jgi:hypothetical protein
VIRFLLAEWLGSRDLFVIKFMKKSENHNGGPGLEEQSVVSECFKGRNKKE